MATLIEAAIKDVVDEWCDDQEAGADDLVGKLVGLFVEVGQVMRKKEEMFYACADGWVRASEDVPAFVLLVGGDDD